MRRLTFLRRCWCFISFLLETLHQTHDIDQIAGTRGKLTFIVLWKSWIAARRLAASSLASSAALLLARSGDIEPRL